VTSPQRPRLDEAPFVAVVLLAAAGALSWASTLPAGPVRALIVFPLALLLPGIALTAAFPGAVRDPLAAAALVPVISIAFYALSSLALALATIELTRTSVVLAVDALVGGCVLVLMRRGSVGAFPLSVPDARRAAWVPLVAIAAAAFALTTVAAARLFPAEREHASTRFAFAGRWARVTGAQPLPRRRLAVRVSLQNHEGRTVRYRIAPRIGGRRWPVHTLELADGASWSGTIGGRVHARPCRQRLVVALKRSHRARPLSLALELESGLAECRRGSR
jgi:uncharacterized membrane protein